MEYTKYPLMCYWNGEIMEMNGVVSYRGGNQAFVFANEKMSYEELIGELYKVLGVDKRGMNLKVKMKYPSIGCFKVIPLSNNNSLQALWATIRHSNAPSMDLFVELVPVEYSSQFPSSYPICSSFTRLLTDNEFFLDNVGSLSQMSELNETIFDELNQVDVEGDEAEEELNMNTLVEVNDNELEDLGCCAPSEEFCRVGEVDEAHVNSWRRWSNSIDHEGGGEFVVGERFPSKDALTAVVISYHLDRCQYYRVAESKRHTITFRCNRKPNSCTWRLRATQKDPQSDMLTIVTYVGPHLSSCVGDTIPEDHYNLRAKYIGQAIRSIVQADWGVKVCVIIEYIKDRFKYNITYSRAWAAKQKAIAEIYGDWEKSYELLPHFMQAMKESNPGTVVHFTNVPTSPSVHMFKRVFWAFGPSIEGFQHCRPIITIDGTHLYGKYHGTLLIAMGTDSNNQIFPLAFALVEGENGDSWPWFMACIRHYVTKRHGICVISDRHLGIMKAMKAKHSDWEEPFAYHRLCIRHLCSNVNTNFKNQQLRDKVEWTAIQNQKKKYLQGLNQIGELNESCRRYLHQIGEEKWNLCNDGGLRYGMQTTNMAEVFNNVLKSARFLPVTALVKLTFFRVNTYFVLRREIARSRLEEGVPYSERVTQIIQSKIAGEIKGETG